MLAYVGALVSRTAVQSIPTATPTVVSFTSEIHDTNDFHSLVTNTERLTVPVDLAGKYYIYGSIEWESNAVGIRYIEVRVNDLSWARTTGPTVAGANLTQNIGVALDLLLAGNYVSLYVYQSSGGNLNIARSADPYTPRFGMDFMGS